MFDSSNYGYSRSLSNVMYKVYAWMTGGLALTALTSYSVYSNQAIFLTIIGSKPIFWLLFGLQIGLVWILSASIQRLSFSAAASLFSLYAALLGVSLSVIFMAYDIQSIFFVLSITAGMFAVMALYGYFTKGDLTSLGSMFLMALVGMIIASIANLFFQSAFFDLLLAYAGVILFTGLVAYDVQKIKLLAMEFQYDKDAANKLALLGALSLYLDFVNLFMSILRIVGRRKD